MAKLTYFLIAVYSTAMLCLHFASAAPDNSTTTSTTITPPKTTTLTPATTTTAKPIPVPIYPGNVGTWNITEGNATCIMLKSAIQLAVNYTGLDNKTRVVTIDVPPSAQVSGSCGQSNLLLSWNNELTLNNTLSIVFLANDTSKNDTSSFPIPLGKFAIIKIAAVLHKDQKLFPNISNPTVPLIIDLENLAALPTTLNHSFACSAEEIIGSTENQLALHLQNSQIEAFRKVPEGTVHEGGFSAAEHCAADEISSGSVIGTVIVTILVIVLIALGAAALVTYVLKKRRAAGSGYENM